MFVTQHIRRENNERSFGQNGKEESADTRIRSCHEYEKQARKWAYRPLYLNVLKTKVKITRVVEDGKIVDAVASFIFLGALIIRDGLCDKRYAHELQLALYEKTGESSLPQK